MNVHAARERLQSAREYIGDPDHMIGPDRAENILRCVNEALAELEGHEPERAPAEQDPPDLPDPQIEVLPLPGDRFMLVLSGWPEKMLESSSERLRQQAGAACVLAVPFPVYAPDSVRSGANAVQLIAAHLPGLPSAARLDAAIKYARNAADDRTP